jgi:hypothetical protein
MERKGGARGIGQDRVEEDIKARRGINLDKLDVRGAISRPLGMYEGKGELRSLWAR